MLSRHHILRMNCAASIPHTTQYVRDMVHQVSRVVFTNPSRGQYYDLREMKRQYCRVHNIGRIRFACFKYTPQPAALPAIGTRCGVAPRQHCHLRFGPLLYPEAFPSRGASYTGPLRAAWQCQQSPIRPIALRWFRRIHCLVPWPTLSER